MKRKVTIVAYLNRVYKETAEIDIIVSASNKGRIEQAANDFAENIFNTGLYGVIIHDEELD